MANQVLTPDIYDISELIDSIKKKYIDISEDTLTMGIYGYLSEIFSNALENSAIMAAEYCNEAVPTKAKFERNVLCHALSLGINALKAAPASMEVMLCLPEELLLNHIGRNTALGADRFLIDKNLEIEIGTTTKYKYRLDYDIIIHRNRLPSGRYVYTAIYDMNTKEPNEVTNITNPYLPAIGVTNINSGNLLMIPTVIRQIEKKEVTKTIIVDNPLESKVVSFEFEDQLAYFTVTVSEGGTIHRLKTLYDGLTDASEDEFCNYMYVNDSRIRIKFNRDSYQPRSNATIVINIYTTKGATCNFEFKDDTIIKMKSERESYDTNLWMLVRPITDSVDGKDRDTVESIRKKIPKQMLLRGSVTTTRDINNYFNFLNSDNRKLYFLEKIHNQIERLYYSYFLLKEDGMIIPTNTLDVSMTRDAFSNINTINFVIPPGTTYYYDRDNRTCTRVELPDKATIESMESNGFLYTNIFLNLINKNPFFTGYYLNVLHYSKQLNFDYINSECECQFIATSIRMDRYFFSDRDTYIIKTMVEQNISADFNLVNTDADGRIISYDVDIYLVLLTEGKAVRYIKGELIDFEPTTYIYTYEFRIVTHDFIDKSNKIRLDNVTMVGTTIESPSYINRRTETKLYVVPKLDRVYTSLDYDGESIYDIVPNITDYSLSNVYSVNTGLDFFYDYTDIMTSYTYISKNTETNQFNYFIDKMPLVRYKYFDTEEKITKFVGMLEKDRLYISSVLIFLEDSFGVDFKFFNTYGPCKLFVVDNKEKLDKTNLSFKFEVKFVQTSDYTILDDITMYIKEYIEDINEINDLHMPNLITAVTNKFRKQVVYFKFLEVNKYDSLTQSLYREDVDEFVESKTVPEFLNVNTIPETSKPDIEYIIIE